MLIAGEIMFFMFIPFLPFTCSTCVVCGSWSKTIMFINYMLISFEYYLYLNTLNKKQCDLGNMSFPFFICTNYKSKLHVEIRK